MAVVLGAGAPARATHYCVLQCPAPDTHAERARPPARATLCAAGGSRQRVQPEGSGKRGDGQAGRQAATHPQAGRSGRPLLGVDTGWRLVTA